GRRHLSSLSSLKFWMAVRVPRSLAMKTQLTISGLLVLLLGSLVSAQQTAGGGKEPTDLTVLKQTWEKSFVIPGRNNNILRPNEDLIQQTRAEKQVIERRDTALPNQPTEPGISPPMPH